MKGDIIVAAAGSLKAAFTEIGEGFQRASGETLQFRFGASGLLREAIEAGDSADVFASADRAHPERLAAPVRLPVTTFATNSLCALVRPDLACAPEDLLGLMLEPRVRLGTSTPVADPSGDYAMEVFSRANHVVPGAADRLRDKALRLTGAPNSPKPSQGSVYAWIMARGRADVFLTYFTNAIAAQREEPDLGIVPLPPDLAVFAEYGNVVLSQRGRAFTDFVLADPGQQILAAHGFGSAS